MSTIEIALYGPGWDQFAYPVNAVRPIADALVSIEGAYNTVYWFDGADPVDNWKVYSPDIPPWVNDLTDLRFGEGYWIHLTESITLRLQGAGFIDQTQAPAQQLPPATYYGPVLPAENFTPRPGMKVFAWTGGVKCGQAKTQLVDGQVVYSINVSADGSVTPGCGREGGVVHFQIEDYRMVASGSLEHRSGLVCALEYAGVDVYPADVPLINALGAQSIAPLQTEIWMCWDAMHPSTSIFQKEGFRPGRPVKRDVARRTGSS